MLSDRAKELEATLKHLRELIDSPTPIESEPPAPQPQPPAPKARPSKRKPPPVLTKVVQYSLAGTPEWQQPQKRVTPAPEVVETERFFNDLADDLAAVVLKTMANNINEAPALASRRLKQSIHRTLLNAVTDMKEYFAEQDSRQASIPLYSGEPEKDRRPARKHQDS